MRGWNLKTAEQRAAEAQKNVKEDMEDGGRLVRAEPEREDQYRRVGDGQVNIQERQQVSDMPQIRQH